MRVSPLAWRLAEEKGLAVGGLKGTGVGGRVLKRDVERMIETRDSTVGALQALKGVQGGAPPVEVAGACRSQILISSLAVLTTRRRPASITR